VNVLTRRPLTEARAERIRAAHIDFSMRRPVCPGAGSDVSMPGEQSWLAIVGEHSEDHDLARIGVHRVPLNNGEDVRLLTNEGELIPASPVNAVVDGDVLRPEIVRRLQDPESAGYPGATFLVVEPIYLDEEWHVAGVAELLLCIVLAELQTDRDAIAVVEPVDWWLKGRARTAPAALQKPIFQNVGFVSLRRGLFLLLTDWAAFHRNRLRYMQEFEFSTSEDY
jgi:hypothetical protein